MLTLKYLATVADAPSQYGDAVDRLTDRDNNALQNFQKAGQGFAPPETALSDAIAGWLDRRGERPDPVIVMVHGYMFDPADSPDTNPDSPFGSIYGTPPAVDTHMSWLPLVGECDDTGGNAAENAIAFCYKSIAPLAEVRDAGWDNSYQHAVFDLAPLAARALATIIAAVTEKTKVRILAHSLGTRTTSQAIRLVKARLNGNLDRAVLLDGAEFCVDAATSFSGRTFDVVNIANRTDSVLRLGAEQMCHPFRATGTLGSCVIGYEGLGGDDRWLDLRLDNPALVDWFRAGHAPDGNSYNIEAVAQEESHPFAGLDHWSCYTNDGNRALVRDLLVNDLMTVERLTAHGVPQGTGAPAYGQFQGQPIPPTPQSRVERQRARAMDGSGVGSG